jgi:hypothetical protein
MSQQIQITGGAKVRDLQDVIIGTSGVLSSLAFNVANGVPKLDSGGKILVSQLPNSVMEYKGTWNAATNTPTLVNGTGNQGDVYLCNVAGTVDFGAGAIAFVVGDQVIYSGSIWQRASGATGTVTSVAVTESGDSLNITGSPITTSGTINIGFNGTNLQYVNGAGNLTTFPILTGYVPYTGATQDVDLGAFKLNAQSLHIKGTGGLGHLGLKHQSASATASANEVSLFADTLGDLSWLNGNLYLSKFITSGNTAARSYTFPDATCNIPNDSLVVHLAGTETITGSKTFTGSATFNNTLGNSIILNYGAALVKGNTPSSTSGVWSNIYAAAGSNNLVIADNANTSKLQFQAASTYTYTFPAATGTLALTSDLSSYVPYTGATGAVNLGNYELTSSNLIAGGTSGNAGMLHLKSDVALTSKGNGYTSIGAYAGSGIIQFQMYTGASTYKSFTFSIGTLTDNTNRQFTLPNASGTLALTSDLSGYLPLAGGTLTGSLTLPSNTASGNPALYFNYGANAASRSWRLCNDVESFGDFKIQQSTTQTGSTYADILKFTPTGGALFTSSVTLTGALSGTSATFSGGVTFGANNRGFIREPAGDVEIGGTAGAALKLYSNGVEYAKIAPSTGFTTTLPFGGTSATFSSSVTATGYTFTGTGAVLQSSGSVGNVPQYGLFYNSGGVFYFGKDDGSGGSFGVGAYSSVLWNSGAYPIVFATAGAERMRITSGGNVGIGDGTITPTSMLHIYKSSAVADIALQSAGASGKKYIFQSNTDGSLAFYDSNASAERMRITSGGNVLIGTASDSGYKLDVNGTGRIGTSSGATMLTVGTSGAALFGTPTAIQMDNSYGNVNNPLGLKFYFYKNGTETYGFGLNSSGTIEYHSSGAHAFYTASSGVGTLRLTIASGGGATFTSSVTATSFFESSSIKGKDIIATNPLLALDIDVIKYTRKSDESKDIRYGYSAEQIHSLMPELTDKDVTAVKYLDVHTILISQLQKEIKELKAKLN